jgi:hypothetical protein
VRRFAWGHRPWGTNLTMKSKRLAHWRTVSIEGGKIQREPIIFREPAELGSGEGRPEDPAHAVAVPFERLAHETQEQMPVAGLHERRTALGGDHQAGGDLRLRMEGIRRQLHAGGEPVPGAPVQSLQRGWLLSRVLQGYLLLHHQVNTLGGVVGSSRSRCSIDVVAQNGMFATIVNGSSGNSAFRVSS